MIVEREYRFVPVSNLPRAVVTVPRWQGYAVTPLATEEQINTYLDTPSQALARQGISFRRRLVGAQAELTMKLPRALADEALVARAEYTQAVEPDAPLAGHPLLAMAAGFVANEPIGPWFTFHTRREGVALRQPAAAIHLTWDHLTLPDDPAFVDDEIEAELVDGPLTALHALADLLMRDYDLRRGDSGKRTRVGRYLAWHGRIAFPGTSRQ